MDEAIIEKVKRVLESAFSGSEPTVRPTPGNGRVWGVLVWDKFEGVDQIERQERLWDVLHKSLSHDEQLQVSAILTMTPTEISDD